MISFAQGGCCEDWGVQLLVRQGRQSHREILRRRGRRRLPGHCLHLLGSMVSSCSLLMLQIFSPGVGLVSGSYISFAGGLWGSSHVPQ